MKTRVNFKNLDASRGVALIIALILLLILTVLGIASMSSVSKQERMAGNVNLQALAFQAASAGVAESLGFGTNENNWPLDADGNRERCRRGREGWEPAGWSAYTTVAIPGLPAGFTAEFRQAVGCFEPAPGDIPPDWDVDFDVPVQLLVLTEGIVHAGDATNPLAMREIEVRVENRGSGESQCAISIYGGIDPAVLRVPNSNFGVDGGEGGCPISVTPNGADILEGAVEDAGRIGQYTPTEPGIHDSDGFPPWNNSVAFAEFMNDIKTAVLAYQDFSSFSFTQDEWLCHLGHRVERVGEVTVLSNCDPSLVTWTPPAPVTGATRPRLERFFDFANTRSGSWDITRCESTFRDGSTRMGNAAIPGGQCPINSSWPISGNSVNVGTSNPLHITYVAGHLGNPSNNSGSGIVITEGGMCWSGTANFDGLQINAGGHFEIIGGGGATTTGAMILTRLNDRYGFTTPDFQTLRTAGTLRHDVPFSDPAAAVFDNTGLRFAGGGSHNIRFRCAQEPGSTDPGFQEYIDRLNQCLEPAVPLEANCNPDGSGIGMRDVIASWREYIDGQRWQNLPR